MQNKDNRKWHKIAESIADFYLPENGLTELDVNGKRICISLYKDQLFACATKCPHAGGNIAGGYIDVMGNVVCPLHRYKFSLLNGRNTSGEGYYLKSWPVEQREDGVYVGMESRGLF